MAKDWKCPKCGLYQRGEVCVDCPRIYGGEAGPRSGGNGQGSDVSGQAATWRREPPTSDFPGRRANDALRLFGIVELFAGLILFVVLAGAFENESLALGIGATILVQSTLFAVLCFAFAGLGDNVIGIHRHLTAAREDDSASE